MQNRGKADLMRNTASFKHLGTYMFCYYICFSYHILFCVDLEKDTFLVWLVVLNMAPGQNLGMWQRIWNLQICYFWITVPVTPGTSKCPFLGKGYADGSPRHLRGHMSHHEVIAAPGVLLPWSLPHRCCSSVPDGPVLLVPSSGSMRHWKGLIIPTDSALIMILLTC